MFTDTFVGHLTFWCLASGIDDGHLMASLCSCHLNSCHLHITPGI